MAASVIRKTKRDLTIVLTDGTAVTPLTLTLTLLQGDLKISIPGENIVRDDPLGVIDSTPALRKGADRPMTLGFSGTIADFSDGTEKILTDWALKNDIGAGWVSTLDPNGKAEVMALHIDITVEGTDHGDGADHSWRMPHCTGEWDIDFSGDFATLAFSGTSHAVRPSTLV